MRLSFCGKDIYEILLLPNLIPIRISLQVVQLLMVEIFLVESHCMHPHRTYHHRHRPHILILNHQIFVRNCCYYYYYNLRMNNIFDSQKFLVQFVILNVL